MGVVSQLIDVNAIEEIIFSIKKIANITISWSILLLTKMGELVETTYAKTKIKRKETCWMKKYLLKVQGTYL